MKKYFAVFAITWQQGLAYRLNFILWRVRTVLQLLLVYFLWWTVFQSQSQVFGYTEQTIISYILISAVVRAVVLSSRVMDVGGQINDGNIVNFLIKPLDFVKYYFSRDIADKLLNITFAVVEILLIVLLLQPPIILQTNTVQIFLFLSSLFLAIILFFSISFIIGLLAFWLENAWGVYFLLFMFIEGFGGGIFPIDILPPFIAQIFLLTPFPYLIYFPSKLYLGTLSLDQTIQGFCILIFWVITFYLLMRKTLREGLKNYTAVGH